MIKTAEEYKNEYLSIMKKYVKRDGVDALLDYLTSTSDFFVAPASGKRHCAFEGGLCAHSINTYNRFKQFIKNEYGENYFDVISDESIAIISLLHDVCKVNTYTIDYRNQKVEGQWVQVPYYSYNNSLPYGHGEKSVYIISGFMRLTREEAMAINWHMAGFDPRAQFGTDLSEAYSRFPVAVLFHMADLSATYLDEKN